MNGWHDPELEDVLQDEELHRIATLLGSARVPDPPLDDAFRTGLRRQLMQQAWSMAEGRESWWRRAFAPPGLAWAGAAVGVILIAAVVVSLSRQGPASPFQVTVTSSLDGSRQVALQQPILVSFNQPMDHTSTEAAVQITPATTVAFSWEGNTLAVQPTSGDLAPNTQYQVTIGPGARTSSGQPLSTPHSITFVTQPPPSPTPIPTPGPTPTSSSLLTGEKQLAPLAGATTAQVVWAADSSAVYFIAANGALGVVPAKGGAVTAIAPDGVTAMALAPAGDRLAYVRAGKIEILTFASGKTDELAVTPAPVLVGWSQTRVVWAAADGIYTQDDAGATHQLAAVPSGDTPVAIAPDAAHVVLQQGQKEALLDVAAGTVNMLGPGRFSGWSPAGTELLFATDQSVLVVDVHGKVLATLPLADAAWSSQDAILLGTDTDLAQVRPDGSGSVHLANGTYHSPVWAPNGASFTFVRGGTMWIATAPALPAQPTALDEAASAVTAFMDARLKGNADQASALLDANGKQAYSGGGPDLVLKGEPRFTRYYIVTQEMTSSDPDVARFVVRLVLSRGKIDVSEFEETLTVVRDPSSEQFVIDQAAAGPRRDLGKGAEVVSVDVSTGTVKITFDSDLDPGTVTGVVLLDANGKPVNATASYANRVVTLSGVDLTAGAHYRLVVLPALRDVAGHNLPDEYDLDLVGPVAKKSPDRRQAVTPTPAPSAAPVTPG